MSDPLILASSSPRRRDLLSIAGIPFEVHVPEVDEFCDLPAESAVAELSRRKALACRQAFPERFILGADTLVALDGKKLGKPTDREDACRMLRLLSGRTHQVFTGITVVTPDGNILTETDTSSVTFESVSESEIFDYVESGEPMDKAGAYAIQGRAALWIRQMSGSPSGVIGLPLALVRSLLIRGGCPLFMRKL